MAIQQREDFAAAHLGLGRALEAAGYLTEAETAMQRALQHDPDSPLVLYRLGQLYLEMKDVDRARTHFEMALEKAAGNAELQGLIRNAMKSLDAGN